VGAQSVIIAVRERPGRFSEHRDSDFSSDSRQGFENGDVAMLAAFVRIPWAIPELLQELLELPTTDQALRVHDLEESSRFTKPVMPTAVNSSPPNSSMARPCGRS